MHSPSLWARNIGVDMHTGILNYIYSLYFKGQDARLSSIGYWGCPDPYLGGVTPDFIACGENGDIQVVDVKSFYRHDIGDFEYKCEDVAKNLNESYRKYSSISLLDVGVFLNSHRVERTPRMIEVVFILPVKVFEECSDLLQLSSQESVIWVFGHESNRTMFRKVFGTHQQQELEKKVAEIIFTADPPMLIRYFRDSSLRDIKRCFSMYLMHSCLHDQKDTFTFDEIDAIMINSEPPLLGHLIQREREDFWSKCLRFLVDVAGVVKQSTRGPNYFEWKARILRSPYYRENVLEKIERKLGGRQ